MSSFIKIIFLLSVVNFLLTAVSALAADLPAEQNPMCWTKEACAAQLKANDWRFEEKNWEQGGPGDICEDMGVCIPAGKTPLSIKIGTTGLESADLGDYIKTIYKYLVGIGGIIAAVLIIKGGFEWATSGGSPERVKGAQATIGGALMGLLLLLGSYTLLYTINPDLVRLRLPGTYMIRYIPLGTKWCKDQPAETKLALAQSPSETKAKELKDLQNAFTVPANPSVDLPGISAFSPAKWPVCGATYYPSSGTDTCQGHICPLKDGKSQVCVNKDKVYQCSKGILSGVITGRGIKYPFVDNNLYLKVTCDRSNTSLSPSIAPTLQMIDVEELQKNVSQKYVFTIDITKLKIVLKKAQSFEADCGFYLVAEINDDPGVDDLYAVGKENGICNKNLHQLIDWEGPFDFLKTFTPMIQNFVKIKPYLFTLSELENGLVCDMPLSRSDFPAL